MELLAYILAMETNDEFLKELLMELFTKDERDMIWQRLKIVTLLKKKIPQYEIAKILNASLCSITRGAKELKKPNSALSTIVDKYLINNEEFQESLNKSLQKQ
ncbi:transcriptional regulator [Brachyspira aalborgi]|jgi:TrpR family trp operon transcriptional repressor|uniref:Transcriptional regulator n=2 Tax=Brachyspira aalborgi TaxID=29522 RepID=A0A5C8CMC9_9SPIR|nr:Trp family transcriptional regulator [Brachyspira aalborgi]MBS4763671.1 transcriptional regulator [Brachyspira sp.]CCY77135.1 trp operon repressor [Brachyspira sp. CAG:700]TXJ11416.1 transcriptional regulator [Brachyspira aalborgi]TXJ14509.1 transcriptional regulator [Brachyspira aalborgi]TXJ19273.1 transcriptional regulator [Brachyspira aalborgi]